MLVSQSYSCNIGICLLGALSTFLRLKYNYNIFPFTFLPPNAPIQFSPLFFKLIASFTNCYYMIMYVYVHIYKYIECNMNTHISGLTVWHQSVNCALLWERPCLQLPAFLSCLYIAFSVGLQPSGFWHIYGFPEPQVWECFEDVSIGTSYSFLQWSPSITKRRFIEEG